MKTKYILIVSAVVVAGALFLAQSNPSSGQTKADPKMDERVLQLEKHVQLLQARIDQLEKKLPQQQGPTGDRWQQITHENNPKQHIFFMDKQNGSIVHLDTYNHKAQQLYPGTK